MSDDLQLNRDDFEDCFAGQPEPVSPAEDLARGQRRLRRQRRLVGGAVGIVVAILAIAVPVVTSQAGRPSFDPAVPPSAVPSTAPTSAARVRACTPGMISIADAVTDPAQRPVADPKLRPAEEDGQRVRVLAVAPNGEVLLEVGYQPGAANVDPNEPTKHPQPGRLYVEDPDTGQRTEIRGTDDLHPRRATLSAAFDESFVAWIEQGDQTTGWEIYAFDRSTKKISRVARSTSDPTDFDPAPHEVRLWNGSAYWAELRGEADPNPGTNIYGRRLASREPVRLVAENAISPVITEGWLYYRPYSGEDRGFRRTSLTGGKTEPVHQGAGGGGLTAFGDLTAWIDDAEVVVYRGSTLIARILPGKGQTPASVVAGDDVLAIVTRDTVRTRENTIRLGLLLDLRGGCRLHQLTDLPERAAVQLAGRTVGWTVQDPDRDDGTAWYSGRLR
ncbi:hypothetical protein [Microlunatus parietis]|uniref:Uncharacterized protein n=1 Tax=Microlunatus parietis TaxID=682979 RepID=A0A7Y9I2G9_9ACTN|nr:hypothetical protein [Microlunatus parietis]NYE69037.1 hypothetical protein [Microlunatus parietis]